MILDVKFILLRKGTIDREVTVLMWSRNRDLLDQATGSRTVTEQMAGVSEQLASVTELKAVVTKPLAGVTE